MKTIIAALAIVVAGTSFAAASTAPVSDEAAITSDAPAYQQDARRKARVPGGSGCDSAHDRAEHSECRG